MEACEEKIIAMIKPDQFCGKYTDDIKMVMLESGDLTCRALPRELISDQIHDKLYFNL